ncbi:MAG: hypothetical protein DI534_12030 [Leifsonia xyli]|nr:MAG: hypothetical protein DI534_12030 [Leifsonia xyli]
MTGAPVPLHHDPRVVSAASSALAGLAAACRTLRSAVVLTDDGFEIARVPSASSGQRLASMASTLQALADAVVRELRIGTTDHLTLTASTGAVVVLRVGSRPCALVAVLDEEYRDDDVSEVRRAAAELAAALVTRSL